MDNNANRWLGYTRRERRAVFVLLILIIAAIVVRMVIDNNREAEIIYLKELNVENDSHSESSGSEKIDRKDLIRSINSSSEQTVTMKAKSSVEEISTNTISATENRTTSSVVLSETEAMAYYDVLLELNGVDSAALDALPGIGSVLSARIIKYRDLLGGFYSVEQLQEVYGLSVETYEKIKNRVMVDDMLISKVNINQAEYKTLIRMPYLQENDVDNILRYRKIVNTITSIDELIENRVLPDSTLGKIRAYIVF